MTQKDLHQTPSHSPSPPTPPPHPHHHHNNPHPNPFLHKLFLTLSSTKKSDKYFRLASNTVKYLRSTSPQNKQKYSNFYKQLLVVRQVIRWNCIYENWKDMYLLGWGNLDKGRIGGFLFGVFEMVGDVLDRVVFGLELLADQRYQGRLSQIDQLQCDCYFIQCLIWLQYHIRTWPNLCKTAPKQVKLAKMLKIIKYILDCLTSYTKFSKRVWELTQKQAAVLGILSSLIGLYDILK